MPEYRRLMQKLADGDVVVLDGATGTEIERLGGAMHDDVWCAMATETHPEVVRTVHENYIKAGAEIIITNTYASGRDFLNVAGLGDKSDELCRRSAELALEARERAGNGPVWVAGSISAFGRWEDKGGPQMRGDLARQAEVLAGAGVDLILLEMLGCDVPMTIAAIEESSKAGLPVWVALSCMSEEGSSEVALGIGQLFTEPTIRLASGPFGDSAMEIAQAGGDVFFVFHSQVEIAREALRQLRESVDRPIGVYPHCGNWAAPDWKFVNMISPEDYLEQARDWVSDGAQIVGGCCGIGLEHMRLVGRGLPRKIS